MATLMILGGFTFAGAEPLPHAHALRIGVGSDAHYGGTLWAIGYSRTLVGNRQCLRIDVSVLDFVDGRSVTPLDAAEGQRIIESDSMESLGLMLGLQGRVRLESLLLFDAMLGGLLTNLDWSKSRNHRVVARAQGWFGGWTMGYGIGFRAKDRLTFRFEMYVQMLSANDEEGDNLWLLPWRLGATYAF